MEKYIIDKNKNRAFAHARRLSETPIYKDDVIETSEGFAFAVQVADEPVVDSLKTEKGLAVGKGVVEEKTVGKIDNKSKPLNQTKEFKGRVLIIDTLPD